MVSILDFDLFLCVMILLREYATIQFDPTKHPPVPGPGTMRRFASLLVTTVKLVSTTRVGSNGMTTIMLYSKKPFDEAMTLRASNGRF